MGATFVWLIIGTTSLAQLSVASFGYKKSQQHIWPRDFKECGGKMQSPIALSTARSIALPLPALEVIGFHNFLPHPLTLTNNGHTVGMKATNTTRQRLPYIFGAMLNENQQYEFESLHFHWGLKNNRGSEHIVNDIRYPMEMHIICRNMAYPDLPGALNHADGLVVLGILFQLQDEDNADLNPILKSLPSIRWVDTKVKLNMTVTLSSLMPKDMDTYYTYRGSLTTPPCSEAITWIIFSTPVPISFRQITKFRMLSSGAHVLANNYRKLQNIGRRRVYMRKLSSKFANNMDLFRFNVTSLIWSWQ